MDTVREALTPEEKRRALYVRQVTVSAFSLECGTVAQIQHGKR